MWHLVAPRLHFSVGIDNLLTYLTAIVLAIGSGILEWYTSAQWSLVGRTSTTRSNKLRPKAFLRLNLNPLEILCLKKLSQMAVFENIWMCFFPLFQPKSTPFPMNTQMQWKLNIAPCNKGDNWRKWILLKTDNLVKVVRAKLTGPWEGGGVVGKKKLKYFILSN